MIDYADAFNIIKYFKNNIPADKKSESTQLENIAKNLTETSNPVLIILSSK